MYLPPCCVSSGAAGVLVGHPFDTVKVGLYFFFFFLWCPLQSALMVNNIHNFFLGGGLQIDWNSHCATTVWGQSQVTPGYSVHVHSQRRSAAFRACQKWSQEKKGFVSIHLGQIWVFLCFFFLLAVMLDYNSKILTASQDSRATFKLKV